MFQVDVVLLLCSLLSSYPISRLPVVGLLTDYIHLLQSLDQLVRTGLI